MSRQRIRREFPHGAVLLGGEWTALPRVRPLHEVAGLETRVLRMILADPRNLVDLCAHHHYNFENARFPIYRDELPDSVGEFAAEYGLTCWLDRGYPVRDRAA